MKLIPHSYFLFQCFKQVIFKYVLELYINPSLAYSLKNRGVLKFKLVLVLLILIGQSTVAFKGYYGNEK